MVEHVLESMRGDIRDVVERIMQRENPQLWNELPPRFREAVHERVQQQLPAVVRDVMDEIGDNIEHLLDVKLMVIRRMEEQPELCNRVFLEVGKKEFRFIINFGFFFGFAIGIPTAILTEVVFHAWWLLPICGVVIGYVTNWLALWMIYEPIEPRKLFGPLHDPRPLHPPPARGGGRLRRDHRRRRHHDPEHGRGAPARAALGPHAPADRGGAQARGRPCGGPGAAGRAGRDGHEGVRHDPRLGRHRGRRVHDDPAHRRGVQPRAVRSRCES